MMTLKFGDFYYKLSWRDLQEAMKQNATYSSQLLADRGNVSELRRELEAEQPDLAYRLDAIADDWRAIRWRLASIVLLERVSDLDAFCKTAHDAMQRDPKAVAQLVNLLTGVDEEERAYWERINPNTMTITLPGGVDMKFAWCPATMSDEWKRISCGKEYFLMGSPADEVGRDNDETIRCVTLTKGFWIGTYEVTQGQWRSVMNTNPSFFQGDNRPVENVSWNDCQEFIRKVNTSLNCGVRLPTEAEWEYACRAGTTTAYFWGDVLNGDKANCDGNYPYGTRDKGRFLGETEDVGSYAPNAWGLYDMHGNVLEWCQDWYGYYGGTTARDPLVSNSGKERRVLRGGSWNNGAKYCRSASRHYDSPPYTSRYYGFRLACSAGPNE